MKNNWSGRRGLPLAMVLILASTLRAQSPDMSIALNVNPLIFYMGFDEEAELTWDIDLTWVPAHGAHELLIHSTGNLFYYEWEPNLHDGIVDDHVVDQDTIVYHAHLTWSYDPGYCPSQAQCLFQTDDQAIMTVIPPCCEPPSSGG
jgi:hypothetical protein